MVAALNKIISALFYLLLFFLPLTLFTKTSEIFEFNKIVLTYTVTILISFLWTLKMILFKKIIFRRTLLDIPLTLFLISNIISTIFSIDPRTSIFGYYSRFNGGLLSTISYLILYWAFVSNMDKAKTKNSILSLTFSSLFVSLYAVFQHFGIDKNIWADDVQNRVFSTLGQPNWLAAWSVAIIPFGFFKFLSSKTGVGKLFYLIFNSLLFATLVFTKSRSGFIAFCVTFISFWIFQFIITRHKKINLKNLIVQFIIQSSIFIILVISFGSPWTASIESKMTKVTSDATKRSVTSILESGTAGSGQIRKIVWKGAFEIWKEYPVFGSGVETFAFTYHKLKPVEHNLTAEWDYLYNKAHNEYLNFLANTGIVGLLAYLIIIIASLAQISSLKLLIKISNFRLALLTGYFSILITNFFGFSVVPTSLLFFLFPAFAITFDQKSERLNISKKISTKQIIFIIPVVLIACYLLLTSYRYWYADFLYAKANTALQSGSLENSQKTGSALLKISPNEPLYHDLQSQIYTETALYLSHENNNLNKNYIELAVGEANKAIETSPANVLYKRNLASIYLNFATIDPIFLGNAKESLIKAVKQAPTDAKLLYNLGLIYMKLGETEKAESTLKHTISIKDNYASARYALAILFHSSKRDTEARAQLEYILTKIDPENSDAQRLLYEIP